MNELLTGAVTGIIFGFFMQKAQVIRYDRQLGALRLRDMDPGARYQIVHPVQCP